MPADTRPARDIDPSASEALPASDAIKTYRYLRIAMIGAVVLLAASIGIERSKVSCWQTSISAYYYTPVRAIFVGCMMGVGLALIVYKGRITRPHARANWEDIFLNVAGMLAPVVVVAPTTDVGDCWSVPPTPRPVGEDGSLAPWVVANVRNNFNALLIAGALGLVVAAAIAVAMRTRRKSQAQPERGTVISLAVTALALLVGWWLIVNWSEFFTRAHGFAAVAMFVFLILAVLAKVWDHVITPRKVFLVSYAAVALLMIAGGIVIPLTRVFGDHTAFALEAYEISFFAAFWIVQTVENWGEQVTRPSTPPVSEMIEGRAGETVGVAPGRETPLDGRDGLSHG